MDCDYCGKPITASTIMNLVGNVVMDDAEREGFLHELQNLMAEYGVDKVDVGWKRSTTTEPPPSPPPPSEVVTVNPTNLRDVFGNMNSYPKNTVFELVDGQYNLRDIYIQDVIGPYTIRSKNPGEAKFIYDRSDYGDGNSWSVIRVNRCSGLTFDGLNMRGPVNKHLTCKWSHRIKVLNSVFRESWIQSSWMSGVDCSYENCGWEECCLRRKGVTNSQQPFAVGTWAWENEQGVKQPSENIRFLRCSFQNNYGESVNTHATKGVVVDGCFFLTGRQVMLYLNHTSDALITGNSFAPVSLINGTPARAIITNIESGASGDPQNQPQVNYRIENNVFGGSAPVKSGINWKPWPNAAGPQLRYSNWLIQNNSFDNVRNEHVLIGAIDPQLPEPENCRIDLPITGDPRVEINDPQYWIQI